ncbi:MAG: hypothetical protein C0603_12345 [Denitrovibrio sp.]|nr:MAG: hypothetical protein C0603_12345 [Denitrovibrio sp.]
MRNIAFLVIIIVTVAIAVSCNIQNTADEKGKAKVVSEKQETGSKQPSKIFTKVIEKDNEDILKSLSALEENLNQKIESINVNVDNTNVIKSINDLKVTISKSQAELADSIKASNMTYQKNLHQILIAILTAVVAILLTLVLVFRYLKKFIIESMIITSHNSTPDSTIATSVESETGASPILSAINETVNTLNKNITEAKYLFDPEKAVKLDNSQKASLLAINEDINFLRKAGYELMPQHDYLTALEKVNDKNYSEATTILSNIKETDEKYSPALFLSGYIAYVSRKYDVAIENLEKACKLEPENAAYLISYGNACLKEKNYDESATALKKAVEIKPNDASAWNNLAHVYIMSSKMDEAIEAFGKAAEIKPDFHEALHNLGLALGKQKRYEEALEAFEKAIAIKDDKHESMYNASCVYAILGKRDGALSNLKNAIALSPDYAAKAKKDKDFKSFKDDEEFAKIIGA